MFEVFKTFPQSYKRWFHKQRGDLKELHIEQVLNGTTKQPISLEDFRLFLLNKDHTIHNLDFHLWFIDYKKRFNELSAEEKAKSPAPKEGPSANSVNLPLDDFLIVKPDLAPKDNPTGFSPGINDIYKTTQGQPFRAEIDSVLRTFFHPDSFKELNVELYRSRFVLYNGCISTHPDIFEDVDEYIYNYMNEITLRRFLHFALQNIRYSVTFFYYALMFFPGLQAIMYCGMTYYMHAPRIYRWPVVVIAFWSPFFLASARSGVCAFRALVLKSHMIHIYELSEYKNWKRKGNHTSKYRRSKKLKDVEDQTKNRNWNKTLDPMVIKYNRRIVAHMFMFSFIVGSIFTILLMSISNEYDAETIAKMMAAAKAAAGNSTAPTS